MGFRLPPTDHDGEEMSPLIRSSLSRDQRVGQLGAPDDDDDDDDVAIPRGGGGGGGGGGLGAEHTDEDASRDALASRRGCDGAEGLAGRDRARATGPPTGAAADDDDIDIDIEDLENARRSGFSTKRNSNSTNSMHAEHTDSILANRSFYTEEEVGAAGAGSDWGHANRQGRVEDGPSSPHPVAAIKGGSSASAAISKPAVAASIEPMGPIAPVGPVGPIGPTPRKLATKKVPPASNSGTMNSGAAASASASSLAL